MPVRTAVLAGISAALLFVTITTYRLERPGLGYDELHQATGAFAYVGRPSNLFSYVRIGGVPLMNMSYTGAIKTAIYGAYLRVSGRPFSIWSWRLLGILLSAAGLIAFCLLAGAQIPFGALLLFLGLIVTDMNLLLQSRHDWGPVALGFLLRMILVGLAVRHLTVAKHGRSAFLLGLVFGLCVFEKLSAAVLLCPVAIILLADPQSRTIRDGVRAAIGFIAGALPAIAVNVYSLITTLHVVALSDSDGMTRRSIPQYVANYLYLGIGSGERRLILDVPPPRGVGALEAIAMMSLLLIAGRVAWTRGRSDLRAKIAGVALLCYLAVGVTIPLLPHGTGDHHWILGTPFQYLAIALAVAALWSQPRLARGTQAAMAAAFAILIVARALVMVSAFQAIRNDRYTLAWDGSNNIAASFAAAQPDNAIVIAASWGVGTQALCMANGRENFVFELYPDYRGPRETLNAILEPRERQLVIASALRPERPLRPGEINTQRQVTSAIFHDLATAKGWEEVPADPAVRDLRSVEIRMFRRIP